MAPPSPILALPGMAGQLQRIEQALRDAVVSDDPYLTEIASHLIGAGGKRLRPALAVAAGACAGGDVSHEVVMGGVSVELVHLGSLYHDDVIDEAETRRGVESVNARWGNLRAILAGDFLLAKASEIAATLGTEVAGLLAATIGRLCEGEVRELQTVFDRGRTEEQYLAAIEGKTASLFAAACRIGAIVARLTPTEIEALTLYGSRLGMAFQVVDDILDLVASDDELGKPSGHDLAEGVYTFPVLRALQSPVEGPELADLLGRPLERVDVERARKLVRSGRGVDDARALAGAYCDEATVALAVLEPSPAVEHLVATASGLLESIPA